VEAVNQPDKYCITWWNRWDTDITRVTNFGLYIRSPYITIPNLVVLATTLRLEDTDCGYEKFGATGGRSPLGQRWVWPPKSLSLFLMCYCGKFGGSAHTLPNRLPKYSTLWGTLSHGSWTPKTQPGSKLAKYKLSLKISSQSIHNFLSYRVNTRTSGRIHKQNDRIIYW